MVKLPLRNIIELEELTRLQSDPLSPLYRHFLSVAQFRARYAPLPSTVARAVAALQARAIAVTGSDSQIVYAVAPAATVERAFGVRLGYMRSPHARVRIAAVQPPALAGDLSALHADVLGLAAAPRPQSGLTRALPAGDSRRSPIGPYWFDDLKQAYAYPSYRQLDGRGTTIATVSYSDFSDADAAAYFAHELLGGPRGLGPEPIIAHRRLGGEPFDPNNGDSQEADVDVQQAAGSAPGARVIGVSVPSAGEGFLYGYSALVERNDVDIISTSYSGCELFYTPAYNGGIDQTHILRAYHELFLQGNAQGITFVFSSGDNAGLPCPQPGYVLKPDQGKIYRDLPGTSYWSSDPNVTSVGGTNLTTTHVEGHTTSLYRRESAIHDTLLAPVDQFGFGNYISNALWGSGGGASVVFAKPWYQQLVDNGSPMRTDPDIAMQMGGCPYYDDGHGKNVPILCGKDDSQSVDVIDGTLLGFIGTSLAAPEFAGTLAVLEQAQGGARMGNANGYIYRLAQTAAAVSAIHQGMPASNGIVQIARGQRGYNPVYGVGTPIVNAFIGVPFAALAGNPQTSTNP